MTSVSVCGIVYDAALGKRHPAQIASVRWAGEHYYGRIKGANKASQLVHEVCCSLPLLELDQIYIGIEEPFYLGAVKRAIRYQQSSSGWIKQQAEIAGAVKGSLVGAGFENLHEANNRSWKACIHHSVGIQMTDKWLVKEWAIAAFDLPDLPDLVQGKNGKIPRPENGRGANAKAVQPDDVYDAAGVMAWMLKEMNEPW
jgi:hypothetical protein